MNERIKVESASEGKREGEKKSQLRLRPKSGKRIHNTRRPQVPFLSHMPSSSPHPSSSPPYSTLHFLVVLLSFIPTSPPTPHSFPVVLISFSLALFPISSLVSSSISSLTVSLLSLSLAFLSPLFPLLLLYHHALPSSLSSPYSIFTLSFPIVFPSLSSLSSLLLPPLSPCCPSPLPISTSSPFLPLSLVPLSLLPLPLLPTSLPSSSLVFPSYPPPSPSLTLRDIFSSNYADGIEFDDGVPGREGSERKEAR